MNTYAKTSQSRLMELTEKLSEDIEEISECVQCVSNDDTCVMEESEIPFDYDGLDGVSSPENSRVRFPPPPPNLSKQDHDRSNTETQQKPTETKGFQDRKGGPEHTSSTPSEHKQNTLLLEKCVQCVSNFSDQLPAELEFVIESWADLPEEIREKIVEMAMRTLKNNH